MLAWLQKGTKRTESDDDTTELLSFTAEIQNVILNDFLIRADTHANM